MNMDRIATDRYARQIMLPEIGIRGQKRLLGSSALIVGLGGLGCPVALYLAGAGVGRLGLCDADTVSASNLQRQILYSEAQTGLPKTEAAAGRLRALSSATVTELWPDGLTAENADDIIGRYDIVVDCCDNFATRYLIDDCCLRLGRPWVHGSIGAFTGQASTFMPGSTCRYADIFPDRDELSDRAPAAGGVLGALPGTVGAIQAAEALKVLAGFGTTLDGRLLTIDIKTMTFNIIKL